METTILKTLKKTIWLGIMTTVMLLSFTSCAVNTPFLVSSVVPAAEGAVSFKKNKNNNYVIKMEVSNLAEVDRLQPAKKGYVVWMETKEAFTRNIGLVTSSKKLNVSFETTSPIKPTRIFITAEEDTNVQYPGSMVVLTTDRIY